MSVLPKMCNALGAADGQTAYKGYLIKSSLSGDEFYISKGGSHIMTCRSLEQAKKEIDGLVGGAADARMFPSYTLSDLEGSISKADAGNHPTMKKGDDTYNKIKDEIAARKSGASVAKVTPQVPWK